MLKTPLFNDVMSETPEVKPSSTAYNVELAVLVVPIRGRHGTYTAPVVCHVDGGHG